MDKNDPRIPYPSSIEKTRGGPKCFIKVTWADLSFLGKRRWLQKFAINFEIVSVAFFKRIINVRLGSAANPAYIGLIEVALILTVQRGVDLRVPQYILMHHPRLPK